MLVAHDREHHKGRNRNPHFTEEFLLCFSLQYSIVKPAKESSVLDSFGRAFFLPLGVRRRDDSI